MHLKRVNKTHKKSHNFIRLGAYAAPQAMLVSRPHPRPSLSNLSKQTTAKPLPPITREGTIPMEQQAPNIPVHRVVRLTPLKNRLKVLNHHY